MNSLQKINEKKSPSRLSHPIKSPKASNQITMIKQNLQIMKNSAQQFLKKGNKQLPPITKARHYLFLNYINQSLYSPNIQNQQNRKSDFLTLQNQREKHRINFMTEFNRYKSIELKKSKDLENSNKKILIGIKKEQNLIDLPQSPRIKNYKYNSNQIQNSTSSKSQSKRLLNIKNFDYRLSSSVQYPHKSTFHPIKKDNNIFHLQVKKNSNIQHLQKTQKVSGQIIKYLHQKSQFLIKKRYDNKDYHQEVLNLSKSKGSLENLHIQQNRQQQYSKSQKQQMNLTAGDIKQKQHEPHKPVNSNNATKQPQLFIQAMSLNLQPVINPQLQLLLNQQQKNIIFKLKNHSPSHQNSISHNPNDQTKQYELLSSDTIQVNKWKLTQNLQTIIKPQIQKQSEKSQFNPLRYLPNIKHQNSIYQTFIKPNNDQQGYSFELPKKVKFKPSQYKQIWMEQIDFQYDKFNKSRYFVEKKQVNLQVKNNRNFSRSLYVNRPPQNLANRNQNRKNVPNKDSDKRDDKNKEDLWAPWGRQSNIPQFQQIQFQNQIKQQR